MGLFEGLFPAAETNQTALFSADSKYRRPVHLSTGVGSKRRTEASAADEEPEGTAVKVCWLHICLVWYVTLAQNSLLRNTTIFLIV